MQLPTTVINSVIGEGTTYNGNIDSVDVLRIDGNFQGIIKSRDVILIGITGKVQGTLSSSRIIIAGVFDGNIRNTDLVIVQPTGLVLGKIEAESVIIESSALMSSSLKVAHKYTQTAKGIDEESSEEDVTPRTTVQTVEKFSEKTLSKMFSA